MEGAYQARELLLEKLRPADLGVDSRKRQKDEISGAGNKSIYNR